MKHAICWIIAVGYLFGFGAIAMTSRAANRPNIVLIMIDDLGWGDLGCYGNDFVETPSIDRLAAEGVRFTDFYAAGAVCSPTRCALQSGQNQARIGITAHIPGHWRPFERVITPLTTMALPTDVVTIAEALKKSDYATGYIGKWHLGNGSPFQPDRQGYDFSAVIGGPHLPGKFRAFGTSEVQPAPNQYRTDFEADLSVEFIESHRNQPFFLMLSPYAVHIPLGAMSDKVEKYRRKAAHLQRSLPHPVYAAMIEHCDDMVGRIVNALHRCGIAEDTMIVFTSDNGGLYRRYDYREHADDEVSSLAPLKGEKGSLHEGGVRVPLIIRYPGLTKPGSVCAEPTISYDFYPTFVALAGGSLPVNQTIDGLSLLPLLKRTDATLARDALYWHYPHYHHDRPASSIRNRDWKLIEYLDGTGDLELYHLADDLGETVNLADQHAGHAARLCRLLKTWRRDVVARMPIPNPNYDPERAGEWWNMRNGQPVASDDRTRFPATEKESANASWLGSWAFSLPDKNPAWLQLTETAAGLRGNLLWSVGSARPVSDLEVDGNSLSFRRAIRWKPHGRDDQLRAIQQPFVAKMVGQQMELTFVQSDATGTDETVTLIGNRIPPLPPRPDLSQIEFGPPQELFNGCDLEGWILSNAEKTNGWRAENGVLVNVTPKTDFGAYGQYGNLRTEQEFNDFQLTIEYNVPRQGNSGVYLRGMYEAQVVDRDSSMQGIQGPGAVFGRIEPRVNAGLAGGEWNRYDLTLVDRHITVVLNGQTVIDNRPLIGCTGGGILADDTRPGPILLQGDHTSVQYRNIVIRPVVER